jgi:hypothetical protein
MFQQSERTEGRYVRPIMTITLIGGPLDGAIVTWSGLHPDLAFPCAATYAWYHLCTDRRRAIYWPLIYQREPEDPRESDAA